MIGAAGQLGRELVRTFAEAGDEVLALARPDFDITAPPTSSGSPMAPRRRGERGGMDRRRRLCPDPERAMRINGHAAGAVASGPTRGSGRVQVSTNEVFDGALERPYVEDDEPDPLNPYGASKLAGERLVASKSRGTSSSAPHGCSATGGDELRDQDPRRGRPSARSGRPSRSSPANGGTHPRGLAVRGDDQAPRPAGGRPGRPRSIPPSPDGPRSPATRGR